MKGEAPVILFLIILLFGALLMLSFVFKDNNKIIDANCLLHFPISTQFLIMCNSTLLEKPKIEKIICHGLYEKDKRQEILNKVYTTLNSTNWTSDNIENLEIDGCNVEIGNVSLCNGTKKFTITCYSNTIIRENGTKEVYLEFYGDVK